jgi:hypothetical protein
VARRTVGQGEIYSDPKKPREEEAEARKGQNEKTRKWVDIIKAVV